MRNYCKLFTILFCLVPSFLCSSLLAADSTATWQDQLKKFRKQQVSLRFIKPVENTLISSIEVLDARPDTAHIGMFANPQSFNKPTLLQLPDTVLLNGLINNKLVAANNKGYHVLIAVRNFWLTDVFSYVAISEQSKNLGKEDIHSSKVVVLMDVFVQKDNGFIPLVRIDTTIWDRHRINSVAEDLVEQTFDFTSQQITSALNDGSYLKRKPQTRESLVSHYANTTIIKQNDGLPPKGIFHSFNDFKNDRVSDEPFSFAMDENGTLGLFIIAKDGSQARDRSSWGVCDGKDIYIMQGGLLFKLYKDGNAWYWMGARNYRVKEQGAPALVPLGGGWAAVGLEPVGVKVKLRLSPFLLNPATGTPY